MNNPPLTPQQIAAFDKKVQTRQRCPVIPAEINVAVATESDGNLISDTPGAIVQTAGNHRVVWTIEELEATDAVEQMVEEMSVDWNTALELVARLRRHYYTEHKTRGRAWTLRQGNMNPLVRALELFELGGMADVAQHRLHPPELLQHGFPPSNCNFVYWNLQNFSDFLEATTSEMQWLAENDEALRILSDNLPWIYERGYFNAVFMFLQFAPPEIFQAHKTDMNLKFPLLNVSQSRKPGVVLRDRPRLFLNQPAATAAAQTQA